MDKPTFLGWHSLIDDMAERYRCKGKTRLRSLCNFRALLERHKDNPASVELLQSLAQDKSGKAVIAKELAMESFGAPYYKIWPDMCKCMVNCSIEIPSESMVFPHYAWEMRLPTGFISDNELASSILVGGQTREQLIESTKLYPGDKKAELLEWCLGGNLCETEIGKSIARDEEKYGRLSSQVILSYQTRKDREKKTYTTVTYSLFAEKTVGECMTAGVPCDFEDKMTDKSLDAIVKIIVATCFFSIDKHQVILPDIPKHRLQSNAKNKRQAVAEQIRIDGELKKCKGWRVGSEIALPRYERTQDDDEHGTGKSLEYGHMRSGHMRMQPHGKGNKERKLIFIPPTVVRPDLPIKASRGYKIDDKILSAKA